MLGMFTIGEGALPTRRAWLADVPPLAWQPDLPDLYPSGLDQVRPLKVAPCVLPRSPC